MTDAFHSPRLTLARAHHHINDFKCVVNGLINSKPWSHIVDENSDAAHDFHKIRFDRELPESLPCILFDATNNLRAVLDQAAYIAAVVAKQPSLKSVKFPFGPAESPTRNSKANEINQMVCRLNVRIRGAIEPKLPEIRQKSFA
jgi:hypothetical protein